MPANDATTWTVPLHVTVSIGAPQAGQAVLLPPAGEAAARVAGLAEGLFSRSSDDVYGDAAPRFSLAALANDDFSWRTALDAALCSYIAYHDESSVRQTAGEWGFDTCETIAVDDTECFVASTPEVVVVAFRGTQQTADWLINLNASTISTDYGYVHRGFYHALHSVRSRIEDALADAGGSEKKLLLTGHSLGGALATIGAAEWYDAFPNTRVYTFGQPAVGFSLFRSWIGLRYPDSFHRIVNDDDAVTRVPPFFRHAGTLYHFTGGGDVSHETLAATFTPANDTPTYTPAQFEELKASLRARGFGAPIASPGHVAAEGFFPSIPDHNLDRYLEEILGQL